MTPRKTYTLLGAATELGIARETLRKALLEAQINPGGPFTLAQIVKAMCPPAKDAKTRLTIAQAIEQERLNEVEAGNLVSLGDVEKMLVESVVLPLRQWLTTLPTTYDVRCNQDQPQIARAALTQARDEATSLLREHLPKEKK